jgi:hypothetical protein
MNSRPQVEEMRPLSRHAKKLTSTIALKPEQ